MVRLGRLIIGFYVPPLPRLTPGDDHANADRGGAVPVHGTDHVIQGMGKFASLLHPQFLFLVQDAWWMPG